MTPRSLPVLLLALLALSGCGRTAAPPDDPEAPAPVVGDRLALELLDAGPWQAGQIARFALRVQHTRPTTAAEPLLSKHVPEGVLPRVRVTFLRGTEELPSESGPALERFC